MNKPRKKLCARSAAACAEGREQLVTTKKRRFRAMRSSRAKCSCAVSSEMLRSARPRRWRRRQRVLHRQLRLLQPAKSKTPAVAIAIQLVRGRIEEFAKADAIAVGHYIGVTPQYAELAIDQAISKRGAGRRAQMANY